MGFFFIVLVLLITIVSLSSFFTKKAQATNITVSAFTASSYTLSATNVTYNITFTAAADMNSFQVRLSSSGATGSPDFTNAVMATLTDDGADVGNTVQKCSAQDGRVPCFDVNNLTSTIASGSEVVMSLNGVGNPLDNPQSEGAYYPMIQDSSGNFSTMSSSVSQAFGTPLVKFKVTEPEGTVVPNANIWMNSVSTSNYFNSGGTTDSGGQLFLFANNFGGPSGVSKSGQYKVHVQPPTSSQYTNPADFTITITEGSTLDCTDRGSSCALAGGGPVRLTRPMAKGKFVVPASPPATVNAAAGSAIANVQVQVRNTESMDPSSSAWVWSDNSGIFYIGGLSAGTYAIEFSLNWGNQNYLGLTPPEAKSDFVVSDTNSDGNLDVTYNSSTTLAASLPYDFGNMAFQVANKTISGTISDSSGNPVSGIKVRANKMMGMGDAQATSGADGTYQIKLGTGNWSVRPEIDYYQNYDNDPNNDVNASYIFCGMSKSIKFEQDNTVVESSTGNNFTVKQSTATITGKVVKPDGSPVTTSIGVNAFSKDGCGGYSSVNFSTGVFTTTVPPGTYNVQANSWDPSYGSSQTTTVTVSAGTTDVGNLALIAKTATIAGRLWADINGNNSYDDGEGVGNVRVQASKMAKKYDEFVGGMGGPMSGGDWASTQSSNETATKGNFTLYVTKGSWTVNVMSDMGMMSGGYSSTSTNYIYTGQPTEVTIASDNASSSGNNFKLQIADATINGRLWVDTNSDGDFDNGEGVSGVWGYAFAESDSTFNQGSMMGAGMGAAINNGSFTIKVPAGTYRVGIDFPPDSAGYTASSMATVTVAANSTTTVNVPVLANNATVRVRFKDTSGNLITNLQYAETFLHNVSGAHQYRMFSSSDLSNGYVDVLTAAGDWYVGYHIDPTTNNYMSEPMSDNKVAAEANQTKYKDITLRAADSTVSGKAYDPSGSPLSGVFVSVDNRKASNFAIGGAMFMRGEVTDSNGNYSLTLPAGTYKVEARFPPSAVVGGQTVSYLNPDASEVTISPTSPATANFTFKTSDATITGTVTLNNQAHGAFVSAYSSDGGYNETITNNGSYTLNVTKNDIWYIKAMYETGNSAYLSDIYRVSMGGATNKTQNLSLKTANFTVPDAVSVTFNCANAKQITLSNGTIISIPANAIKPSSVSTCSSSDSGSNITVVVNPTAQMSLQDKSIPIGVGYEITATDSNGNTISDTFNSNVTITIPYSASEINDALGGTVDESLLNNGYWDTSTSAWRSIDSQVLDTENNKISISTNHFTLFGILATTDPSTVGGETSSSSSTSSTSTTTSAGTSSGFPEVYAKQAAVIKKHPVVAIVEEGALPWDSYLSMTVFQKRYPFHIGMMWQVSDVYDLWFKSFFNNAKILYPDKPSIFAISYEKSQLGKLPEASLKLAYSSDEGKTWKILPTSVLDKNNKTVAALTKNGGYYMLVAGYGGYTVSYGSQQAEMVSDKKIEEKIIKEEKKAAPPIITPEQSPAPPAKKSFFQKVVDFILRR